MSHLMLLVCLLVGISLIDGKESAPNNWSPLIGAAAPAEAVRSSPRRSPGRHTRDVPLSSYGRLGEREDDNDTTTIIPEIQTTETSTVSTTSESPTTQPSKNNGAFGFELNLPNGISFKSKWPQNAEEKTQEQAAGGSPSGSTGFQAPKLPIPSFGFGRK